VTERIEVKVSHRFQASAERVFDAWLQPEKVRVWMRTALQSMGLSGEIGQIEIDPKVGGTFLFSDMRDGKEMRHRGTYLELERPRKIVFTWIVDGFEELDPSDVELTIEPKGEGCIATIIHRMDCKWADYAARTEKGWRCYLEATGVLLESELTVETQLNVSKPTSDVFEALVNPDQMSRYFISSGSGRLDAGQAVTWSWADCGAELTVAPQEIEADRKVAYLWNASGVETRVSIELQQCETSETNVIVREAGWPRDNEGTARCLEQMQGWMHMLCCLKAYLEFGINLRAGIGRSDGR
jgi:uncharacterized protein YndB with AHSA1/START domain